MEATRLILLTGSTGHVGFRTLRYALEKGYAIRAAVRSEAKAETVRTNRALAHIDELGSKLSFIIVPNFLADGAFDEAVKGVTYVIHIASPIPGKTDQSDLEAAFIKPAVQGTLGLFESAKKEATVERIVVTSSAVAIPPIDVVTGQTQTDYKFKAEDRAKEIPPPFPNDAVAYVASKIAALHRGEAWMQKERPTFDVIWIIPSYVGGRDDLVHATAEFNHGTNRLFLASVLDGADAQNSGPRVMNVVHVDDVAKAHVESLDPRVAGDQAFLLTNKGGDARWDDAKDIVAKHFPEAVKDGLLPNNGSVPHMEVHFDIAKTEDTFGKLKPFEEVVISVAEHYLELHAKEREGAQ